MFAVLCGGTIYWKMGKKTIVFAAVCLPLFMQGQAQQGAGQAGGYLPEIHGTVRAKYEYEPQLSSGRFEVRNARVSVSGSLGPVVDYKAEIDLSDEGKIKMLDAYGRFKPLQGLALTIGQMRVPFTIDAHRSPHQQFFANRSFIAKQVGNVRDVGMTAGYVFGTEIPVKAEAGIFNGSGLTDQKDYWTKRYNFSAKVQAMFAGCANLTASVQRIRPGSVNITMWDIGSYYEWGRWHVEAEYLRKVYHGGAFPAVNAVDAFGCYSMPLKDCMFSQVSFLGRYDYMSDHSDGVPDESGNLTVDDSERHRLTAGVTFRIGKLPFHADIRVNYEKYFYGSDAAVAVSEKDKFVVELMCRF